LISRPAFSTNADRKHAFVDERMRRVELSFEMIDESTQLLRRDAVVPPHGIEDVQFGNVPE